MSSSNPDEIGISVDSSLETAGNIGHDDSAFPTTTRQTNDEGETFYVAQEGEGDKMNDSKQKDGCHRNVSEGIDNKYDNNDEKGSIQKETVTEDENNDVKETIQEETATKDANNVEKENVQKETATKDENNVEKESIQKEIATKDVNNVEKENVQKETATKDENNVEKESIQKETATKDVNNVEKENVQKETATKDENNVEKESNQKETATKDENNVEKESIQKEAAAEDENNVEKESSQNETATKDENNVEKETATEDESNDEKADVQSDDELSENELEDGEIFDSEEDDEITESEEDDEEFEEEEEEEEAKGNDDEGYEGSLRDRQNQVDENVNDKKDVKGQLEEGQLEEGQLEESQLEEGEILDDSDEDVVVEAEENIDQDANVQEENEKAPQKDTEIRRKTYFVHDDRWMDGFEEERSNARNRKLWDKTDLKWEHDLYVENEQGPKTKEELEESARFVQSFGNRPPGRRHRRTLNDFMKGDNKGRFERRKQMYSGERNARRPRKDYESFRTENEHRRADHGRTEREHLEQKQYIAKRNERGPRRDGADNTRDTNRDNDGTKGERGSRHDGGDNTRDTNRDSDGTKGERGSRHDGGDNTRDTNRDNDGTKGERGSRHDGGDNTRDTNRNLDGKRGERGSRRDGADNTRVTNRGNDGTKGERGSRRDGGDNTRHANKDNDETKGRGDRKSWDSRERREQNKMDRSGGGRREQEVRVSMSNNESRERKESSGKQDRRFGRDRRDREPPRGRYKDKRGFGAFCDEGADGQTLKTENGGIGKTEENRENDVNNEQPNQEKRTGDVLSDTNVKIQNGNVEKVTRPENNEIAVTKDEKSPKTSNHAAPSSRKWSEMRSHGYGRGKPIHKPKKSAADFAREVELQKDKDKKNEGETTPEFESEMYSDATETNEKSTVDDVQTEQLESSSSGRKRYSAQRQKQPQLTTANPAQNDTVSETTPRETQIVYLTPQGYPAPMFYPQQHSMPSQDMNSTRPYMLPSHPYPMPPSANNPGPGGDFVPYDPNTGLVYAPQPYPILPTMPPFISQPVYPSDINIGGQHLPMQQQIVIQPPQPVQVGLSRPKGTSAIPIKSPQNETMQANN